VLQAPIALVGERQQEEIAREGTSPKSSWAEVQIAVRSAARRTRSKGSGVPGERHRVRHAPGAEFDEFERPHQDGSIDERIVVGRTIIPEAPEGRSLGGLERGGHFPSGTAGIGRRKESNPMFLAASPSRRRKRLVPLKNPLPVSSQASRTDASKAHTR